MLVSLEFPLSKCLSVWNDYSFRAGEIRFVPLFRQPDMEIEGDGTRFDNTSWNQLFFILVTSKYSKNKT